MLQHVCLCYLDLSDNQEKISGIAKGPFHRKTKKLKRNGMILLYYDASMLEMN